MVKHCHVVKQRKFRDLEVPGKHRLVDARRLREVYLKNFTEHTAQLKRLAGELRIDFRTLRTDEPIERDFGRC